MKKIKYEKYFKGKKITLMGFGGFGRGLKEAEFLIKNGADLIITDMEKEENLKKEVKRIKGVFERWKKKGAKMELILGKHRKKDFIGRDLVLYPNGVKLNNEYIKLAKEKSKMVTKSIALVFWIIYQEKFPVKTIGVTGTKGKSTLTSLIKHLLENDGKKVWTGGNLRGSVNLPILSKIKEGDFLLAELDSWLLQGFGDLKISPQYSFFTNFFNDHQNYYSSMELYFNDKANIFKFQKENDFLFLTDNSNRALKKYFKQKIKAKKIITFGKNVPNWKFKILGNHNLSNISQVLAFAQEIGITKKIQKKAMESFKAVEGRLEFLGKKRGIYFYNDNNSTTPISTIESLRALKNKYSNSKIILLAGGSDKNFLDDDYKKLAIFLRKNVDFLILFKGTGTDKLIEFLGSKFKNYILSESMKYSFEEAVKISSKGDVLILSPGMASFGVFKNEYVRNDMFLKEFSKF